MPEGKICKSGLSGNGICDLVTPGITLSVPANVCADKVDTLKWNTWKRSKAAFWASGSEGAHRTRWVSVRLYRTQSTLVLIYRLWKYNCGGVCVCFLRFTIPWPSLMSCSISAVVTQLEQLFTFTHLFDFKHWSSLSFRLLPVINTYVS